MARLEAELGEASEEGKAALQAELDAVPPTAPTLCTPSTLPCSPGQGQGVLRTAGQIRGRDCLDRRRGWPSRATGGGRAATVQGWHRVRHEMCSRARAVVCTRAVMAHVMACEMHSVTVSSPRPSWKPTKLRVPNWTLS